MRACRCYLVSRDRSSCVARATGPGDGGADLRTGISQNARSANAVHVAFAAGSVQAAKRSAIQVPRATDGRILVELDRNTVVSAGAPTAQFYRPVAHHHIGQGLTERDDLDFALLAAALALTAYQEVPDARFLSFHLPHR